MADEKPVKVFQRLTGGRKDEFVEMLKSLGGSSGNQSLRTKLGWEEDFYWRAQGQLIEDGIIQAGRGRGGTVRLVEVVEAVETPGQATTLTSTTSEASPGMTAVLRERELYSPFCESIRKRWINRFGYDEYCVDETHSRGAKDTGGTFSRPDITVCGIRRYKYLPKRLEIVTVEIKPADAVTVLGVLEAVAHREAAHRAYTFFACSRAIFDASPQADRILEPIRKGIESPESVVIRCSWGRFVGLEHDVDGGTSACGGSARAALSV